MNSHALKLFYAAFVASWILVSGTRSKTMVETIASGSDCKCKCVLSTKEGGPCIDGTRETIYLVETVPIGSDCRCSCNTPAPIGCENRKVERFLQNALSKTRTHEVSNEELHRNVAKLLRIISKLNRMLTKRKPKSKVKVRPEVFRKDSNGTVHSETPNDLARRDNSGNRKHHQSVIPMLVPTDTQHLDVTADSNDEESGDNEGTDDNPVGEILTPLRNPALDIPTAKQIEQPNRPDIFNGSNMISPVVMQRVPTPTATSTTSSFATTTSTSLSDGVLRISKTSFYRNVPKNEDNKQESILREDAFDGYAYEYDEFGEVVDNVNASTTATRILLPRLSTLRPSLAAVAIDNKVDYNDHVYDYGDYYEEPAVASTTTVAATTTPKKQDPCGTLSGLSEPQVVGTFGRKQGAWMRDPIRTPSDPGRADRIYVANFYFGDLLLEFDDLDKMRTLQYGNSYNLPHKWIGTGHIVYNGSFYFNRAFSTSLIKYDLNLRAVNAWSSLAHAIYQSWVPLDWRGHFLVHLAADEHGLWVIYPSRDPSQPQSKLTYVVNRIDPNDLSVLESYKTKVLHPPSHFFVICGILYSTNGYNSRNGRVTNAFDTKTLARRSIFLGIENLYSYTVQFSYNPADRKIYAWDNGRQVEYDVRLVH